jgi:hypothetical protein
MTKKLFVILVALVVVAFSLSVLAQAIVVQGKVEALDTVAKKVTINGTEYLLSDQAAQAKVKVGDMVEATVQGNVVQTLKVFM